MLLTFNIDSGAGPRTLVPGVDPVRYISSSLALAAQACTRSSSRPDIVTLSSSVNGGSVSFNNIGNYTDAYNQGSYDVVTEKLSAQKSQANGYFILIALSISAATNPTAALAMEQLPKLDGKKMFLYLAPKKAGVAKKSQQKLDRERREAEQRSQADAKTAETGTDTPANGGLLANAKISEEALKKLNME